MSFDNNKLLPNAWNGTVIAQFGTQKYQPVVREKGEAMPLFTVTSIIDGDTFEVSPKWNWNGTTGTRVRPTGYDATELNAYGGQAAKAKLSKLIHGKEVEIREGYRVDRGRLICKVHFKNTDLADYFPECH